MKKLLALLLVLLLMGGAALAEDGAELDWAAYDALIASIGEKYEDLEIDSHRGEQPLYPIVMSVE